jgi:CO/xanthine dehydrogenase FAD-binding subunit
LFARLGLPGFDYVRAESAEQAVHLLSEGGDEVVLLMGGTDVLPRLRDGLLKPRAVLDVKGVPGLRDIHFGPEQGLTAGAAVTMNQLARHPDVLAHYPLLAQAAGQVASYQVRNRATLGGNICNASPCADTPPAVLVLEGRYVLVGPQGERSVPASDFCLGPGRTALKRGEFLAAIRFPPPPPEAAARYLKLGRSRAGDLALVGVAVFALRGGSVSGAEFRIALGSVAPTPVRARSAELILAANGPGEPSFALAAEKAMEESSPITDVRGSASYQRMMVHALTLRALRSTWESLCQDLVVPTATDTH